ncbi:ribonuclease HII [Alphaproteobacteria bacterium]|nr:ribonuclease HII [Alphaproteobacteria bacterium]
MPSFTLESASSRENLIMIGVDEAGRGSWAGPLVAASCWIDFEHRHLLNLGINDSKKLTHLKRKQIFNSIGNLVKYSTGVSTEREIDNYGLTFANVIAMKRSIFSLVRIINSSSNNNSNKYIIYVDGKYKPDFNKVDDHLGDNKLNIKFENVIPLVKGDSISKTIALASIIAKETRDSIMRHYSSVYPKYSFDTHFGYGTAKHKEELLKYGVLAFHRKSFKPISTICSQ